MTSASKFNMDPNGGVFDVNPENGCASPNVKIPLEIYLANNECGPRCSDSDSWPQVHLKVQPFLGTWACDTILDRTLAKDLGFGGEVLSQKESGHVQN